MEDIAPALLEQILTDFRTGIQDSEKLKGLLQLVSGGKATYPQAEEFAYEVGSLLSQVLQKHITSAALPDGKMFFNIADRVLRPVLEEDHQIISDVAVKVQEQLNQKAHIGLKAKAVPVNEDRIAGIIDKIADADNFDDVGWMLEAPVVNFSQAVVDDTLKANVDFQGKAGLRPRIVRHAEHKCCEWCSRLEGEYEYPKVPQDVYRRHERCRCTVEFNPGDGRRQNVHSKQWTGEVDRGKIAVRKKLNLLSNQQRSYEPDIQLGKSVGAKSKAVCVKLPNGEQVSLIPGTRVTHVQTIAGKGRDRQIDIVDVLTSQYPESKAELWQKKKGLGHVDYHGEDYLAELHWYEEPTAGRVKWKVKPDADGNWFFEDE